MIDYFDPKLALDNNTGTAVPNAVAEVFSATDTSFSTPLAITDPAGVPMPALTSSPTGIYPAFKVVSGETQVLVRSGDLVTPMSSLYGIFLDMGLDDETVGRIFSSVQAATEAAAGAVTAAASAQASAQAAQAVGSTNDEIIAGRVNADGSQTEVAVSAKVATVAASEMGNSETPLAAETDARIAAALSAFTPSSAVPIRVFIGASTGAARPSWDGPVDWVTTIDVRPTHFRSNPPTGIMPDTWAFAEPEPIVPVVQWSDNFNRANGSPIGTTPVGAKTWLETAAWQVISNAAASSAASGVRYATVDAALSDGILKATLSAQGADHTGGVVFRYVDANNHLVLAARVSGSDFHYRLIKRTGGTATVVAVLAPVSADGDVLEVTMSGSTITIRINGAEAWSGTLTEHQTATRNGLYKGSGSTNGERFDDVSFSTLGY